MAPQPGVPVKNTYVISRVFNVGQQDMGMRIYVDLASMERSGELEPRAEIHMVVPVVDETVMRKPLGCARFPTGYVQPIVKRLNASEKQKSNLEFGI